ncbi:MAG TPA: hypothetical protein VHP63_03550, partial [candidate division Zixibacteria bacterium]|nr:hypothetical protein [candidate division Zixibacteria bacterium]
MSNSSKRILLSTFLLLLPILAYLYFVRQLSFTQDDAYITYRYVANYLNGDGLVFNIGERVEGFTNFGWTVLLILVGGFKGDYIAFSKILGTIFGAGVIVVTFLTARRLISSKNYWFSFLPPFLLGANMALAYWSQSGLETAAFAFMAALSVYFYLTKSRWLILALTLAVWTRPEGALVAIILILTEGIVEKKLPRYSFSCALIAFILSIPFVLFKYFYYGSILPNPFYAKTGMSLEQVQAGLEYTGLFLKHYGFYGAGIILPILFWKKLDTNLKSVLIFTCAYILYVILIGGDVLKVHRFFLPIFGLSAILISAVIRVMSQRLSLQARALVSFSLFIFLISATYMLPMDHIKLYLDREQGLVTSMSFLATNIKKTDSSNFTAAVSTIGIFSHLLLGHQVTDMLGLTDSTIARHSQSKNEEFETTWRERNYNAEYVLSCKPDYIVFSTGVKPSAPAEQALLIYSQFVENYVSLTWYQPKHENETIDLFGFAFKKIRDFGGRIVPTYPAKYVHHYKKMCDFSTKRMYREAIQQCDSAIAISPKPFLGDMIVEDAY